MNGHGTVVCTDALRWLDGVRADLVLTDPPHIDHFRDAQDHRSFAWRWTDLARSVIGSAGTLVHSCSASPVELANYMELWAPDQVLVWPWPDQPRYTEGDRRLLTPNHHFFIVHRAADAPELRWSGSTVLQYPPDGDKLPEPMHKGTLDLWKKLITAYVPPDALVCDPFCGKGEIPRACREIERLYIACDIDPKAVAHCHAIGL